MRLALRRLFRYAAAVQRGGEEQFYAKGCDVCGTPMLWNRDIFPRHENHRCDRCAPREYWQSLPDALVERTFRRALSRRTV